MYPKIIDKFIKHYNSIEFILNPASSKELKQEKLLLYNIIINHLNNNKDDKYYKDYLIRLKSINKNYNMYYKTEIN